MQRHWLHNAALSLLIVSGLLATSAARAESAVQGPVGVSSHLQHPSLLTPSASSHFAPFQPRLELKGALGSDRSLMGTEGWAPLWQDDFNVLYTSLRAMTDDGNNEEYNLGVGYRALRGSQIGGLHGWIDKRDTQLGSTFYQGTLGVELLTLDTDFRFNVYIPLTGTKHHVTPNIGSSSPYLAGSGIFYDTNGLLAEEPQKGLDLEAGYRLPIMQQYVDAFRVYGGGYAFMGNETDDVVGLRARTQIDVNPWLSVGARIQRDDERGTQGFLEATLRFPITSKKMIQREGVRARMDESPERDVDIVTGAKQVDTGLAKPVINTTTEQVQRVLYVDNTAAANGTGTKENPYNTLKTAEANLLSGDILYVFHGDGTTTNQDKGIIIAKDNVSLIGSGVNFVYDGGKFAAGGRSSDFSGSLLLAAGAAPVITNTDATNDIMEFLPSGILIRADNAYIAGVSVQGTERDGIVALAKAGESFNSVTFDHVQVGNIIQPQLIGITVRADGIGAAWKDVQIRNSTLSAGNQNLGIRVSAVNGAVVDEVLIANNNITGLFRGIETRADGGSILNHSVVRNNTLSGGTGYAIGAIANTASQYGHAEILDNTILSGSGEGIYAGANSTNSTMHQLSIIGNTATNRGLRGAQASSYSGGLLKNVTISDNNFSQNAGSGILVIANSTSVLEMASVTNNIVNNNLNGLDITASSSSRIGFVSENNIANENTQVGLSVYASGTGAVNGRLVGNTSNDNVRSGISLISQSSGSYQVAVEGNMASNNGNISNYYGIAIDNDGTGTHVIDLGGGALNSAGGNRIYGNLYRDVFIDSRPGTASGTFGTVVAAQNNWWGVGSGLNQGTRALFDNTGTAPANGSRIDASNWLPVDPGL